MANVNSKSFTNSGEDEVWRISIPAALRDRPIQSFKISTRLRHVLEPNIRRIGELHGLPYAEVLSWRGCGRGTLEELQVLVRRFHPGKNLPLPPVKGKNHLFVVPPVAGDLNLAELPLSVRLDGVLQRCGYQTLGELDQVEVEALQAQKNCGATTIREMKELIRRAGAGEFSVSRKKDLLPNLQEMGRAIDAGFARLSGRDQKIFQARLRSATSGSRTLQDIGLEFNMTRERVRQITSEAAEKIQRGAGPKLGQALEFIIAACQKLKDPLTPERLEQWLAKCKLPHAPSFYVGVLYELECFVTEAAGFGE